MTLSRVLTHQLCDMLCGEGPHTVGAAATACSLLAGPLAGGICAGAVTLVGAQFFSDLQRASDDGKCFALRNYFFAGDPRGLINPTVIEDGPACADADSGWNAR